MKQPFYKDFNKDKIQINWNKNPIPMKTFLSFLLVYTEISRGHLGYSNGWTLRENKELKLLIKGGGVGGIEYLEDLQFGHKLQNPYNNYVNVFYIFHLLSTEGKLFFIDYYKDDIQATRKKTSDLVSMYKKKLQESKDNLKAVEYEIEEFMNLIK